MKEHLDGMIQKAGSELHNLPEFAELLKLEMGWGMPYLDIQTVYLMLRTMKPRRYIEIGSGLSTYVARLALTKNKEEGFKGEIICVEPHPSDNLIHLGAIELISKEVQDLDPAFFDQLEDGDVLFIDSSHIVKLDSDVPFLLLEVLPRLKKGVIIHLHDTPFPYNTPYPADFWLFNKDVPPMFWTEAMLTQGFLSFNDSFKIMFSAPLLRFHCENVLKAAFAGYQGVASQPNTFSSLWIRRCA